MKLFKILSFILVFGLLSCQPQTSGTKNSERYKTILIAASGEIELAPNMASFSVDISCEKKKMSDSRQGLAERQKVLLDILKEFEIEDSNIQTGYINFRKNYKWVNSSNVFIGYLSSISTNVTLKDISKIDDLYSRIMEEEVLDPRTINFSHTNLDSIGKVAYQIALENANSTVDQIMEKMDEDEKQILRIGNIGLPQIGQDENTIVGLSGELARREYKYKDFDKIQISKGSIQISKNLTVEYKIK